MAAKNFTRFVKAQASALAGSLADKSTFLILLHLIHVHYLAATVLGNIAGGVTNFLLGKNWVFDSADSSARKQAVRYLLVWNGNMLLNAGGVALLKETNVMNATLANFLSSFIIGCTYTYYLQKNYVFK